VRLAACFFFLGDATFFVLSLVKFADLHGRKRSRKLLIVFFARAARRCLLQTTSR